MIISAAQIVHLLAQTSSDTKQVRELIAYEFGRLAQFDDPRVMWIVVATATALLAGFVVWFYHRERDTLRGPLRGVLTGLRLLVLAALALYFLDPEKRVDQQIVTDSQVIVLVDTSQSMSVEDELGPDQTKLTRSEAVGRLLIDSPMIENLLQQHNVVVAVFDEKLNRVTRRERKSERVNEESSSGEAESDKESTTDWVEHLQPQGSETRLGSALRTVLESESGWSAGWSDCAF